MLPQCGECARRAHRYFLWVRRLVTNRGKPRIQIPRDFNGLVKSGEMLVVLGRPRRLVSVQKDKTVFLISKVDAPRS